MKTSSRTLLLSLALLLTRGAIASAQEQQTAFPLKVSSNGRYFVDQNNKPVFWLGTTQWQLWRDYKLEDAKLILEKSKSHGFTFVQVKLLGGGNGTKNKRSDGTQQNVYGEKPWMDDNPLTPNEAFFQYVDAVIKVAAELDMFVLPAVYHQSYRKYITAENARPWAKWLGQRYKDVPNIVWTMTPEARKEFVPDHSGVGGGAPRGRRRPAPDQLQARPLALLLQLPAQTRSWLDFNSMQTWNAVKLIYPMLAYDYGLKPAKPILMAEGAYEAGTEYGFSRHAAVGSPAGLLQLSWRGPSTPMATTTPGACFPPGKKPWTRPARFRWACSKKIFMARKEWWLLVPDQSVFASGGELVPVALPKYDATEKERTAYVRGLKPSMTEGRATGDLLHLAARHEDGKWAMIYLSDKASFSVNMNKISSPKVNVSWVNPITGDATHGRDSNPTPA